MVSDLVRTKTVKGAVNTAPEMEKKMASTKVYEMVTERIVKELEQGIIPWQKPWSGCKGGAFNYKSGRTYCLMNQFILLHRDGYLTFNQCKAMGGKVKKGAKAEVVFEWIVKNY